MKRVIGYLIVLPILLLGASWQNVVAAPVDSATARLVAQSFLASHGVAVADSKAAPLKLVQMPYSAMYLFVGDSCFVLVAGNDASTPILGYSANSVFDVDNLASCPSVADYLASFEAQLLLIDKEDLTPNESIARRWSDLLAGTPHVAKGSVAPLLSTRWGQGDPYSRLCPYDTAANARCVAGCLATAMAQVMRYWNYPLQGIGSHCYTYSTYGRMCADFANTTYDWNNMPDVLSSSSVARQIEAVSIITYHCGVALEMHYKPTGSSAFMWGGSHAAVEVLVDNFGYQSGCYVAGLSQTTQAEWTRMLKDELDNRRPVLYMGTGEKSGGHAFVCDGYDAESLFHFNWGWNGMYDGYFAIGALNPGSGGTGSGGQSTFNNDNYAIFNLLPPDGLRLIPSEVMLAPHADTASAVVVTSKLQSGWQASTSADWLSVSPTSGNGSNEWTTIKLMAGENLSGHERSAVVTIQQGYYESYIKVKQYSCNLLENFPFVEDFEGVTSQCWTQEASAGADDTLWGIKVSESDYVCGGSNSFWFYSQKKSSGGYQYLISMPMLLPSGVDFEFGYRRTMSYDERFDVLYSTTDNNPESFVYLVATNLVSESGWHYFKGYVPQNARYIAIRYHNKGSNGRQLVIDQIVITPVEGVAECNGVSQLPYVESFEDTLPCWTMARATNANELGVVQKSKSYDGKSVFVFNSTNTSKDYNQYLITPQFDFSDSVRLSFRYRKEGMYSEYMVLRTSSLGNNIESFNNIVDTVVATTNKWAYYETVLPPDVRYVMLNYITKNRVAMWIDDFRIESLRSTESISSVKVAEPILSVSGLQVSISGLQGEMIRVYDVMGRQVFSCRGENWVSFRLPAAGIYVMQSRSYRSFVAF